MNNIVIVGGVVEAWSRMNSGVAWWEIDGMNGGVRHRHGCRVMGCGGEEHYCGPRGRVLLLLAVDTDDRRR